MNKKMLRRIAAFLIALVIVAGTMLTAYAESSQYVPYESYTYWDDISGTGRKLVYNRPMYEVKDSYNAKDFGVEYITELVDVCTDKNGNIYLLDCGAAGVEAQIIVLDQEYNLIKVISSVTRGEEVLSFIGAQNVYVHSDSTLYLCDTENQRVLNFDIDGNYID